MIFKQDESRRAWVFGPLADASKIAESDGVKVVGDSVRFAKANFTTAGQCEDWLRKNTGDDVYHVKTMLTQTKALEVTDDEWQRMLPYITNPDKVKMEDFRVYRSWLANNVIDRDRERFPKKMLGYFSDTLPGKSKLFNHAWYDGTPEGRHYAAEVVKVTYEEMLRMCGNTPIKNFTSLVKKAEEIDGGLFWLVGRFYVPASDTELIFKIDAGIYSFESIGFRAPVLEPYVDEDGSVLWEEWKDNGVRGGEATEGSWVFLGAQYGARTGKSAMNGSEQKGLSIDDIEDVVESALNKRFTKEEKSKMLKFKIAGVEHELDPEKQESMQKIESAIAEVETKLTTAEGESKTLRDENAAMKKVFDAAGFTAETTEEQAKQFSADASASRNTAIEDAMRYGQLTGAIASDEEGAKAHRDTMAKLTTDEINRTASGYKAIWEKENPPAGQIKSKTDEGAGKAVGEDSPNAGIFSLPL